LAIVPASSGFGAFFPPKTPGERTGRGSVEEAESWSKKGEREGEGERVSERENNKRGRGSGAVEDAAMGRSNGRMHAYRLRYKPTYDAHYTPMNDQRRRYNTCTPIHDMTGVCVRVCVCVSLSLYITHARLYIPIKRSHHTCTPINYNRRRYRYRTCTLRSMRSRVLQEYFFFRVLQGIGAFDVTEFSQECMNVYVG